MGFAKFNFDREYKNHQEYKASRMSSSFLAVSRKMLIQQLVVEEADPMNNQFFKELIEEEKDYLLDSEGTYITQVSGMVALVTALKMQDGTIEKDISLIKKLLQIETYLENEYAEGIEWLVDQILGIKGTAQSKLLNQLKNNKNNPLFLKNAHELLDKQELLSEYNDAVEVKANEMIEKGLIPEYQRLIALNCLALFLANRAVGDLATANKFLAKIEHAISKEVDSDFILLFINKTFLLKESIQ